MKQPPSVIFQGVAAFSVAFLAACASTGGGTATVPVAPMCTILAVDFEINPKVDVALVSERTDPAVSHGFTRFRAIGTPRGNPAVGFTPDVYGISEAWSRNSAGPVVYQAQAHPARRPASGDFNASAWSIQTQDAAGTWSPVIATFSANRGNEQDDPAAGGLTVPQLMPVGVANPQVFGCAGARSEDNAVRTTWLIEAMAPNAAAGTRGDVMFIQDLLNGDDRFVRNAPGPLIGPANPPTPTITGRPGNPVREGSVQCAMTQLEDNLATRELHMLAISNGVLFHIMASDFGPATSSPGSTFNRFRAVSQWAEVGQALGGGFGNIVAATLVASHPTAISVFFVAESGGRYSLWHAVRFSANGGSWRPADDVLRLNGGHPSGAGFPFHVAAGTCPVLGQPQDSVLVYAMWDNDHRIIWFGRFASTPREWLPGLQGNYSALFDLSRRLAGTSDTSRHDTIQNLVIVAGPFRDDARPPP